MGIDSLDDLTAIRVVAVPQSQGESMPNHIFHPPAELPDQAVSYVETLQAHKDEYGPIPMNGPKDLAEVLKQAKALQPKAKAIHDLELKLAAMHEDYSRAALPLWTAFSERLGYAKVYAEKNKKTALLSFLRGFVHHTVRHAAAKASSEAAAPAKS